MGDVEYKAHKGETPFISACIDEKLDIAKDLYAQGGVDLNARTDSDTSVLEELAFKAANKPMNFTITRYMGKDVSITDPEEVRKILGSDPEDEFMTYFRTALFVLHNGADPNNRNTNGQSAVFTAAGENAYWLIELLAQYGADLNMKDNWGLTPLHFACRLGYPEATGALLKGGAFTDPQDEFGFTPAFEATAGKHLSVLKVLAEYGADFELGLTKAFKTNTPGTTPLKYAEKHNFKEIAEFLQTIGTASLKIKDSVDAAEWKWEENDNGYEGVKIAEEKLLWYSHREDTLSPSSGAVSQEFKSFLKNGPEVSGVPKDIIEKIKLWITE